MKKFIFRVFETLFFQYKEFSFIDLNISKNTLVFR